MAYGDQTEFKAGTKETIAKRANFRCIVPDCVTPTQGPGASPDQTASTGTACHIFSAAKNGPRGQGGLTPEELRSASNGVWACATHGRLIDTNEGAAFPASLLLSWKELQEERLRSERGGHQSTKGWIHRITVQKSVLFKPESGFHLGKATLLTGPALGKSAVLEWVAATLGDDLPSRWIQNGQKNIITVEVFFPTPLTFKILIESGGPKYFCNDLPGPEARNGIQIVHVREDVIRTLQKSMRDENRLEDHDLLAKALRIRSAEVRNLIPEIESNGTSWGKYLDFYDEPKLLFEDKEGEEHYSSTQTEVILRHGGIRGITFSGLSGSERMKVLLEFATALARARARHQPTLLLLDNQLSSFDDGNLKAMSEHLQLQPFQTIATRTDRLGDPDDPIWQEWACYEVRASSDAAEIIHRHQTPSHN